MRVPLAILSMVVLMLMPSGQAGPLTVDPETIVPLPDNFDMESPGPSVPPEIARFQGVDRNVARRQAYSCGRARQS
jgi:hypothetical protein